MTVLDILLLVPRSVCNTVCIIIDIRVYTYVCMYVHVSDLSEEDLMISGVHFQYKDHFNCCVLANLSACSSDT
jgi:hypothetical protein